jgi:hypothetical protein
MLYVISYDLRLGATSDDYNRIDGVLMRMGARRALYSQWILRSNLSSSQIAQTVWAAMDANDRLLVSEITNNWAGYNLLFDPNTM